MTATAPATVTWWRANGFHRLLAARTVSILGTALSPVALAFAILGLSGATATTLSLVVGAQAIAEAVVPLIGGALADRLSRSRLMATCDGIAAAAAGLTALLLATDHATTPVLMTLAVVSGASTALFLPALNGLMPQLISPGQLQTANGILRLFANGGRVAGPVLGGLLVVTVGPVWGLAANAASFAVSAVLIAGLRTPAPVRAATTGGLFADLRDGWTEFSSRQWLWALVAAGAIMNLAMNAGLVVLGPVIARSGSAGAGGWSIVLAAFAAGMVTGTMVAVRIRVRRPLAVAAAAFVPMALPFALLGAGAPMVSAATGAFVAGVSLDILAVLWDTVVQRAIPVEAIGRVTSYDMVGSFALAPLGLLAAGPVAAAVGAAPAMLACAVLIAASGLAALAVPGVRRLAWPTEDVCP